MSLAALLVLISSLIVAMATARQVSGCPSLCQCATHYYVYCGTTGIADYQVNEVLSQVSPDAVLLDLSSNHISRIPTRAFMKLSNLEYLNLTANSISELQDDVFQGLSKLRELSLGRNKISTIKPDCFNGLSSLRELDLANNLIQSLPVEIFKNLTLMEKLHLQNNRISDLSSNIFVGLPNLQLLNLSHNELTSVIGFVFSGLESVKVLSLADNNLSEFSLDAFNGLTHLEELFLDRNNISDITFMYGNDFYLSLKSVSLAENYVVSVPSHVFPHNSNLKHVDLSYNILRRVGGHSFSGLFLETLTLKSNNISEINRDMFKDARVISNLNLGHNQIRNILTGAFDSFRENIILLEMQSNQLTFIHPGMFRGMRRLKIFNLARNAISSVDSSAFRDLEALQELNLSGNLFSELTSSMISGPLGLRRLLIACNPLQRLSGFTFDHVDDKIFIESNSTMTGSTPTSAVITWPYKDGSQLYWSLSVQCMNYVSCQVPAYDSTLRPFVTQVTVTGLKPGATYFVCVTPVFLSSDVNVSQCVHVRTQMDSLNGHRHSTTSDVEQERGHSHNSSPSSQVSTRSSSSSSSNVMMLIVWLTTTFILIG